MRSLSKKTGTVLLLTAVFIGQLGISGHGVRKAEAADNGLALKPYMGWSSYSMQVYDGPSGNWTSAQKLKQQSDAMHEELHLTATNTLILMPVGIAIWTRCKTGSQQDPVSRWAEEFTDYIHANGQKVGVYMIPSLSHAAYDQDLPIYGAPGCSTKKIVQQPVTQGDYWNLGYKMDFSNSCGQAYIDSIADQLVDWGIDFVKLDSVTPGSGHNDTSMDARGAVKAWSQVCSSAESGWSYPGRLTITTSKIGSSMPTAGVWTGMWSPTIPRLA